MLLEVMLSVLIVIVGVVFVISSFITSVRAFKASRSYLDILYLMGERMWEYEGIGKIDEGSDSGSFDGHEGAEWEVEAEEIEDAPLNETTLVVMLKEGEKERSLKAATYFFKTE